MIVTCPACETRYLVEDADLGGEAGRRVRCASCGHLWHYSAEAAAIHLAVAAATAELEAAQTAVRAARPAAIAAAPPVPALRAEPGTEAPSAPVVAAAPVRPAVEFELPTIRRGGRRWGWIGALAVGLAVGLIIILGRHSIVASYGPISKFYQSVRLIEPAAAKLELSSAMTRTPDSITVAGDIVNNTPQPLPVTRLRVTLRDGANNDLDTRIIEPPVPRLLPGATAAYSTTFEHPSITAIAADVAPVTE